MVAALMVACSLRDIANDRQIIRRLQGDTEHFRRAIIILIAWIVMRAGGCAAGAEDARCLRGIHIVEILRKDFYIHIE